MRIRHESGERGNTFAPLSADIVAGLFTSLRVFLQVRRFFSRIRDKVGEISTKAQRWLKLLHSFFMNDYLLSSFRT
jgi:hypothetical protein